MISNVVIELPIRLVAGALCFDKQRRTATHFLVLSSIMVAGEQGKTPQAAMNISGVYANAAVIITPRRDMPREQVSFSGLRFPYVVTSKVDPIASVRITQRPDELLFECLDSVGKVVLTQLITKAQNSLEIASAQVTFRDFYKGQRPELGRVKMESLFKLSLDENHRLIVDMKLNYSSTTLFVIPVPGHDRGVYAFAPVEASPSVPR